MPLIADKFMGENYQLDKINFQVVHKREGLFWKRKKAKPPQQCENGYLQLAGHMQKEPYAKMAIYIYI